MSEQLTVESALAGTTARLALGGELDLASAGLLEAAVDEVVAANDVRNLVLDLSGLDFMDSTGLRALVVVEERSRRDGFDLVVCPGDGAAARVLEVSGLGDQLFTVAAPDDVAPSG